MQTPTISQKEIEALLSQLKGSEKQEHIAEITTAVALTDEEKKSLRQILSQRVKTDFTIDNTVDPSVLGGMRIEIDEWVFDSTLAKQLAEMKKTLVS